MENVLAMLPIIALLACPVMMAVCFFAMRRTESDAHLSPEAQAGFQLPEERIADLQQQLLAIRTELAALQGRDRQAPPAATGREEEQPVDMVSGTVHAG